MNLRETETGTGTRVTSLTSLESLLIYVGELRAELGETQKEKQKHHLSFLFLFLPSLQIEAHGDTCHNVSREVHIAMTKITLQTVVAV